MQLASSSSAGPERSAFSAKQPGLKERVLIKRKKERKKERLPERNDSIDEKEFDVKQGQVFFDLLKNSSGKSGTGFSIPYSSF